jgi:hypothetical protein
MILFQLFQTISDLTATLPDALAWSDAIHHSVHISPADWSLIAQQFDQDVFADFRNFFNNFIESGQVWALLIGLIVGYLIRSLTSYG